MNSSSFVIRMDRPKSDTVADTYRIKTGKKPAFPAECPRYDYDDTTLEKERIVSLLFLRGDTRYEYDRGSGGKVAGSMKDSPENETEEIGVMSEKEPELEAYGFGESLADAIAKVTRLRQSHDRLLAALRGMLEVYDEYSSEYEDSDFDAKAVAARIAIRRAEEAK